MRIRYSQLRTLIFTFTLAIAVVSVYTRMVDYWDEVPVNLPEVESQTPIIIRLCPEYLPGNRVRGYREHGEIYFSKEKAIKCTPGGGGG
jgi:hypothetical protein